MSTNEPESCPAEEVLVVFVEGGIEAAQLEALERHLDGCPTCCDVVGALRSPSASGPDELQWTHLRRGDMLGRYRIESELGRGDMGIVYSAHDDELGRDVALKVLDADDPAQRKAIVEEARRLASVNHPNVVEIYDVLDEAVMAMERVEGQSLRQWLQEQERPVSDVIEAFVAAGRGLAATHRCGTVHRDVKPDNILIDALGNIRLTDFGLATASTLASGMHGRGRSGTLAYMAPEVIGGSPADARSDQFSYCVALFEALVGHRPFDGLDRDTPIDFRGRRLPRRLRLAVARGLHARREARFPSMDDLLDALTTRSNRAVRATVGAGVIIAAAATASVILSTQDPPCGALQAQLDAAWDDEAVARVETRLAADPLPYAPQTAQRVAAALRRYERGWKEVGLASCGAERSDETMACLTRLSKTVDETTTLLSGPGPSVVDHAIALVESLPPVALCRDEATTPRLPVRSVALLARVRAHLEMDQVGDATRLLDEHRLEVHDPNAGAEIAYYRGLIAAKELHYQDAEALLAEAYAAAEHNGQRDLAARASMQLMHLYSETLRRLDQAETWANRAEHAARATGSVTTHAQFLHNLGMLRSNEGRKDDAMQRLGQALQMLEDETGPDSLRTLGVVEDLGNLSVYYDDHVSAQAYYGRALAGYRKTLGDEHPAVMFALQGLSKSAAMLGDHPRALALAQGLVAKSRVRYPPVHPALASHLATLGQVAYGAGQSDLAISATQEALAMLREALPAKHVDTGHLLVNLGVIRAGREEYAQARARLLEALEIFESQDEIDPSLLGTVFTNLALSEVRLEEYEAAREHYGKAVRIAEQYRGPKDLMLVHALTGLGNLLTWDERERERGVAMLERAYAISSSQQGRPSLRANAAFTLGKVLHETASSTQQQRRRAVELIQQARSIYLDVGPGADLMRGDVEAWLAGRDLPVGQPRG